MVKVLTGVQPGQASEVESKVVAAGSPVRELQEKVPQPSILDSIIEESAAPVEDVAAGIQAGAEAEIDIQQQREREAVPDIITRRDDPPITQWEIKQAADDASTGVQTDGGMADRATNMANVFTTGGYLVGGLQSKHGGVPKEIAETTGAMTPEGTLDRGFLQMASVITENFFAGAQFGAPAEGAAPETEAEAESFLEGAAIAKAQGNKQLGDQIHREYQRYRNVQEGKPSDEYQDLSPEQATVLGDMAKEMYALANKSDQGKNFLLRGRAPDGQTTFTITKHGADRMRLGNDTRKRLFPRQHVRPSKTPLPGGRLEGEGRKYTRDRSGRTGTIADAGTIHEAMRNLNQVANVVDPQRMKILFATALPVLSEAVGPDHPFAVINHVGQDKVNKLVAKLGPEQAAPEYANLVKNLGNSLFGVAQERNGANHLTYYIQTFNGRIAPQQTNFDPTSSKSVRFVTRNAVPAEAKPGSRIERNLRQMYAMMLVKGADSLLPDGREAALERATPELVRWGKELRAAFNKIDNAQVQAVAEAIANNVPLTDPNFPQLPDVSQDLSPTLLQKIASKGEDGQHFIDGVMDFTDYYENKVKGRPHYSYFNAYMDGKTNGLASNGIQMGSEQVAYKTGVLRNQGKTLLDDNIDIRDDLKNTLSAMVKGGFDGTIGPDMTGPLENVATALYSVRDLNKATTMTFGYGKELESFKDDIDEFLSELELSDAAVAEGVQTLVDGMGSRQMLIDTLHGKYIEGLANALDENALKSRALMRSAAYVFALSNEIFTIPSAIGSEIAIGGTETTGAQSATEYSLQGEGLGDRGRRIKAQQYGTEVTSAAVKRRTDKETGTAEGEVGGYAYGGAVPAPVQSLDAATVALTASGKSWGRLRSASNGNPYLHTIYDAFKVDAMGYDVVLDEVNKNWLDAGMRWSYLEETKNSLDTLRGTFKEKYGNRPANDPLTEGEAAQMQWFLETKASSEGKQYPANLYNKMGKLIDIPSGVDTTGAREMGVESAKRIVAQMKAAGYDIYNPPKPPTVGHLKAFMRAFNDEVQIGPRLGRMVNETNNKKKELAKKIRRDGKKVYQYYAH